jgi:anaerobic selenocysteine-containing dehydrogenase
MDDQECENAITRCAEFRLQQHFQRRNGIEISHGDAQEIGVATGDRVEVSFGGDTLTGAALVQRRLRRGVVRLATAVPYVGPGELRAAPEETADA